MKKLLTTTTFLLIALANVSYGQDAPYFEETKALAEQGNVYAQNNLGNRYSTGEGVTQNYAEAVRWYRLAAEQGHANAQNNLGGSYVTGEGVPKNNVRAYMWWSIAAAQGLEEARRSTDMVANDLTPDQLARGQDMATRCFESDFQDCE